MAERRPGRRRPPDRHPAAELTEAGADWQVQAFGHAEHSFMAPHANRPELGIRYDARTAARAWSALEGFLAECLGTRHR